jgi:hypothetical protein
MKDKMRKIKMHMVRMPLVSNFFNLLSIYKWKTRSKNDSPLNPPSIVKQRIVISLAKKCGIHRLVETGTYLGDMIYATKNIFDKIDSIELGEELYKNAVQRFKNHRHIKIWNGDSATVLAEIIKNIDEPSLFWLDAHYSGGITARSASGDTPIEKELDIIFNKWNEESLMLIDDARCFTGNDGYPTVEALEKLIRGKSENLELRIENDIIRIKNKNL